MSGYSFGDVSIAPEAGDVAGAFPWIRWPALPPTAPCLCAERDRPAATASAPTGADALIAGQRVEPNIATATKERPGPSTRNGYSAANPIAYRTLSERPATAPESAHFVALVTDLWV